MIENDCFCKKEVYKNEKYAKTIKISQKRLENIK